MDFNFHYYVTYTAAIKAGFPANDATMIARAAQYVDECYDITTQGTTRLVVSNAIDSMPFYYGNVRKILQIWPVFHFLPGNFARIQCDVDSNIITSHKPKLSNIPHLICGTESHMTAAIVEHAKTVWDTNTVTAQQKLLQVGITMHVLADTFAHQGFAGVPSGEINEVAEVKTLELKGGAEAMQDMRFKTLDSSPAFTKSSFGYLGHGRIGHLPDQPGTTFSCHIQWHKATDKYMVRCNPLEFYCAYLQMIEAMQYIRGTISTFRNQVDRAMLLDTRQDNWVQTKRYIDMFNSATTDSNLVRPWFILVTDVSYPDDYQPFCKKATFSLYTDFEKMSIDFRDFVYQNCPELKHYYNLYT